MGPFDPGLRTERVGSARLPQWPSCLAVEAKARPWRPDGDSLEVLRESFLARSANPGIQVPANHDRKWRALETFVRGGPAAVLLVASGARWWFEVQDRDDHLALTAAAEQAIERSQTADRRGRGGLLAFQLHGIVREWHGCATRM